MARPSPAARAKSRYAVHPGVVMVQNWVESLPEKTGRSLAEWLDVVQTEGPPAESARRDWLKTTHKLGANAAGWIAKRAEGKGGEDSDPVSYLIAAERYVEEQYAGTRAGLRPIYEKLLAIGLRLGKDAKACPCQTMVPLYRHHVFAQIKSTTRTRIDLGLALAKTKLATGGSEGRGAARPRSKRAPKRLIETGGLAKGDRITHRIPIESLADIDDEVRRWLKIAFDLDR